MTGWVVAHDEGCPVTLARASLLADLADDPENPYLLGAVPEYDEGGDQEVELCECGVVRSPIHDPAARQAAAAEIEALLDYEGQSGRLSVGTVEALNLAVAALREPPRPAVRVPA